MLPATDQSVACPIVSQYRPLTNVTATLDLEDCTNYVMFCSSVINKTKGVFIVGYPRL